MPSSVQNCHEVNQSCTLPIYLSFFLSLKADIRFFIFLLFLLKVSQFRGEEQSYSCKNSFSPHRIEVHVQSRSTSRACGSMATLSVSLSNTYATSEKQVADTHLFAMSRQHDSGLNAMPRRILTAHAPLVFEVPQMKPRKCGKINIREVITNFLVFHSV